MFVGGSSIVVRISGFQSREPGFESSCCCFKALAILFIPHCLSSLSCINEYLATELDILTNSLCAVTAAWLNASREAELSLE